MKIFWAIRYIFYALIYGRKSFFGYMGKPVFLKNFKNVKFGRKVRILPGSRFEVHSKGGVIEIGDDTSIGQGFHCTAIGELKIGGGTVISANVCVTDIDHAYSNYGIPILEQDLIFSKTLVGRNSFIGFGAVIQAGTVLGENCIVGANSVVRGNFPSGCVIVGAPGRIVKKWDSVKGEWKKYNGYEYEA